MISFVRDGLVERDGNGSQYQNTQGFCTKTILLYASQECTILLQKDADKTKDKLEEEERKKEKRREEIVGICSSFVLYQGKDKYINVCDDK